MRKALAAGPEGARTQCIFLVKLVELIASGSPLLKSCGQSGINQHFEKKIMVHFRAKLSSTTKLFMFDQMLDSKQRRFWKSY